MAVQKNQCKEMDDKESTIISGKNKSPTFLSYDKDHIEDEASIISPVVAYVAAVTFLPSLCLTTLGEYTYRHIDSLEEFMKYAVKMASRAMIYISSFIKIGSGIQKLIGGYTYTQSGWCTHKHTFIFSK
jgi:hypothetical protein